MRAVGVGGDLPRVVGEDGALAAAEAGNGAGEDEARRVGEGAAGVDDGVGAADVHPAAQLVVGLGRGADDGGQVEDDVGVGGDDGGGEVGEVAAEGVDGKAGGGGGGG